MRIVLDSSVVIELERKNHEAIELIKNFFKNDEEVLISTVAMSEVLVGPYFSSDFKDAMMEIKQIISQFSSVDLDAEIAGKIAQYWAYLISEDVPVQFQDVAIAATFTTTKSDFLITQNKKHFEILPEIGSKAFTVSEFKKFYEARSAE